MKSVANTPTVKCKYIQAYNVLIQEYFVLWFLSFEV